ncbi:MAG: rhodanese-related sulfurtransferase [Planctomycetota bacterium]|jgi:rhodanese-related sulfurtransferase
MFRSALLKLLLMLLVTVPPIAIAGEKLDALQTKIASDFSSIEQIDAARFTALNPDTTILIDVRELDEYSVSHLKNSQRVSPDIVTADFIQRFAESAQDKTFVFYCSVGYRSSELAEQLSQSLKSAGARNVMNLKGGIFNWHNQSRALFNENGQTDKVHPYNSRWGRLLDRQDKVLYQPDS